MARTRTDRNDRGDGDALREVAATRHLCTGVYLERAFRWTVLNRVHNDSGCVIPPSYGFELNPVISHAWRAWIIEMAQGTAVLAVLVVGFVVNRAALVALVAGLVLWFLLPVLINQALGVVALLAKEKADVWLRRFRLRSEGFDLQHRKRLMMLSLAGCLAAVMAPSLAAGFAHMQLAELLWSAAALGLPIAVIVAIGGVIFRSAMTGIHNSDVLEPRRLTRRQQAIAEQQRRPCVIYRRPPSTPEDLEDTLARVRHGDDEVSQFVGAGKLVHRWLPPLTVRLLPTDADPDEPLELREYATPPFAAHALVRCLAKTVQLLADEEEVTRLPGLVVNDRLYVAEADAAHCPARLWKNPSYEDIDQIIDDPHGLVHHFLETSVPVYGGELVTTVFLRVTIKGRTLSLDFAACALTRTPDAYHALEAYKQGGAGTVFRTVLRRWVDLPVEVARLRRLVEVPPLLLGALRARTGLMAVPRCGTPSIREDKSTPWKQAQLDKPVIHDYIKIIEQRLLATTEAFLAECKVDTSTFRTQAQQIINQGVLNMGGGSIEVKQSAVGPGGQVYDQREMPNGS